MMKSDENRKQDLGLKTSVKSINHIPKPVSKMILGSFSLLVIICGFNFMLLWNMGLFSSDNRVSLNLDQSLLKLQGSVYSLLYMKMGGLI